MIRPFGGVTRRVYKPAARTAVLASVQRNDVKKMGMVGDERFVN
jgi:hypothetical protein